MSNKRRAKEKLKKQNTPEKKAKRAKKAYYQSQEAKDKWEKKKRQRNENKAGKQQSAGKDKSQHEKQERVFDDCIYLVEHEKPGKTEWCKERCNIKCPYAGKSKKTPAGCRLPEGEAFGGFWCLHNCKLNCPFTYRI